MPEIYIRIGSISAVPLRHILAHMRIYIPPRWKVKLLFDKVYTYIIDEIYVPNI